MGCECPKFENRADGIPDLLELLQKFSPWLKKEAVRRNLELAELQSFGALIYAEALQGYDHRLGCYQRRWFYYFRKRLVKLAPKKSDALAHLVDICVEDEADSESEFQNLSE